MAGIGFTLGDQPLEHAAELLAHVHATGLVALRSIDAASAEGTLASIRFLKRPEPPMAWLVQLLGPQDALERLPTLMQGEEYTIVRFENGIHLSGSAFDGLSDAAAVRARAEEVCRHLESMALRATASRQQGMAPVDVAGHVGVDRRSVRRWRASYDRAGPAGVDAKPAPGRPPKLDARRRSRLERVLRRGAEAAGFNTPLWTCPRVADMVRREFGVRVGCSASSAGVRRNLNAGLGNATRSRSSGG